MRPYLFKRIITDPICGRNIIYSSNKEQYNELINSVVENYFPLVQQPISEYGILNTSLKRIIREIHKKKV